MKNDIYSLPLWLLPGNDVGEFATDHKLKDTTWLLPQLVNFFGNMQIKKNSSGENCLKETLFAGFNKFVENSTIEDPKLWFKGLLEIALIPNRTYLLKGTAYNNPRYAHLVPLVLSGFKQNQDVPYMSWARNTLHFGVDVPLLEAMLLKKKIDLPKGEGYSELIKQICSKGGKVYLANTCASLSHCKGTVLENCPKLVRTMATQTWLAHPSNRDTTYMVLDWLDWDNAPEPIFSSTVLVKDKKPTKKVAEITHDEKNALGLKLKYTVEQTNKLLELYANGEGSSIAEIATNLELPERSVIAKLSSLGVYKKKPYLNKRGDIPVKKEEYIERIAKLLNKDISLLDSLEKTNKSVLQMICEALEQ